MSSWDLEETFQQQIFYLAFLTVIHSLSPTFLPPPSLLSFLQRVDRGLSAYTLDSFPP